MDIFDKFCKWLEVNSLEEILQENDLDDVEALTILWSHGHIRIPMWLEDDDYEEDYEL